MSRQDRRTNVREWTENPNSRNMAGRTYPAKRAIKVTTVAKWVGIALAVIVLVKMVGGQ